MMYLMARGSGHPVLFLHGIPTSCALWDGVIDRLASQFQCIAVDLPGLGRSASTPHGFRNLKDLAASIEAIRIEHRIDKWHVVGHDAGCAIAVHYVHRFPHRVGRLALLTPSMFPELKPFYLFGVLRKPVIGELMAPAINLIFWNVVMRLALAGSRDRNGMLKKFQAPFRGLRGSWRLMSLLRWGHPAEVLERIPTLLPEILVPTLVFHGSKDPAVPELFARRACDLMPNSELILLDSGHFLPISQPVAVAEALARFFGTAESAALPPVVAAAGYGAAFSAPAATKRLAVETVRSQMDRARS
jgi:pimeloyl-ACP methyl ester carboxylesterase